LSLTYWKSFQLNNNVLCLFVIEDAEGDEEEKVKDENEEETGKYQSCNRYLFES
jgi:hypothetical protein